MSSPALATTAPPDWGAERARLLEQIARLEQRLAWFERQLFGEKSERRHLAPPPEQLALGAGLGGGEPAAAPAQAVAAHQRRRRARAESEEPALFFDPARVPVETIVVPNPETEGLAEDAYEVIGEKVTHRLAQPPCVRLVVAPIVCRL